MSKRDHPNDLSINHISIQRHYIINFFSSLLYYRDATLSFRGTGHTQEAVDSLKQYEIGILPPHERIYRCAGRMRISGVLPE